jgi:hypothetical protein
MTPVIVDPNKRRRVPVKAQRTVSEEISPTVGGIKLCVAASVFPGASHGPLPDAMHCSFHMQRASGAAA